MGTKKAGLAEPGVLLDKRRSTDRRTLARTQDGSKGGRREADADSRQATSSADQAPGVPRKRRATRDGRQPLGVYLRPTAIKALKMEALERETTASAIVADAVDGWLRANGQLAGR